MCVLAELVEQDTPRGHIADTKDTLLALDKGSHTGLPCLHPLEQTSSARMTALDPTDISGVISFQPFHLLNYGSSRAAEWMESDQKQRQKKKEEITPKWDESFEKQRRLS